MSTVTADLSTAPVPTALASDMPELPAPRLPTAADARRRGEDLGLEGAALEVYVRAGATERHEARVKTAREGLVCVHGYLHPTQGEGDIAPGYHIAVRAALAVLLSRCRVGGHRNTGRDGGWLRYTGAPAPPAEYARPRGARLDRRHRGGRGGPRP